MTDKRVTSQDVADLAGVSRTTVSFVLNNDTRYVIRPETKQKVFAAAEQLGYVPNIYAQGLASNRTKTIGLVMNRDTNSIASDIFLPQIIGGLLDSVKRYGFNLLIEWVEPGEQRAGFRKLIRAKRVDGMILTMTRFDDKTLEALEADHFPAVVMGTVPNCKLASVDIDNTASAKMITQHLIELGHERIAFISNASLSYTSPTQRFEGYKAALADAGLVFDENLVRVGDFDAKSGYEQMRSLLDAKLDFSAVMVASDNVAFGAMSAMHEAGVRIPQDISISGFDNIPLAAYAQPALTTVNVPAREIAIESCELLLNLIAHNTVENEHISMETLLVQRLSTQKKEANS